MGADKAGVVSGAAERSPVHRVWEGLVLLGCTVLLYFRVGSSFFAEDDFLLLTFAQSDGHSLLSFLGPYLATPIGVYFRPLSLAFFLSESSVFGLSPGPYHWMNLLIHSANAFLVLLLCRNLLSNTSDRILPLFAGILFAVHPRAIQAVAFISCLPDLLSLFFLLVSAVSMTTAWRTRTASFAAVLLPFAAALLFKEIGVIFPVVIGLFWLQLSRGEKDDGFSPLLILASLGVVIVYGAVRSASVGGAVMGDPAHAAFTPAHVLLFLLKGAVGFFTSPLMFRLVASVDSTWLTRVGVVAGCGFIIGAVVFISRLRSVESRRSAILLASGLLLLLPVSPYDVSLRSFQENRFLYHSLAFFASGSALFLAGVTLRQTFRGAVVIGGGLVAVCLALCEVPAAESAHRLAERLFHSVRDSVWFPGAEQNWVVLDSPRLYHGLVTGIPAEGVDMAIRTRAGQEQRATGLSMPGVPRSHVRVLAYTFLEHETGGAPVRWTVADDTLVGEIAEPGEWIFMVTPADDEVFPGVKVETRRIPRSSGQLTRLAVFPYSVLTTYGSLVSFGRGEISRFSSEPDVQPMLGPQ